MTPDDRGAAPSIGIAVPTYDRADQLDALLRSVPPGIAVWISDNGRCLDDAFARRHPAATIRPVPQVVPMFVNWNLAARQATSDWVLVPSDDDLYYPGSFDAIARAVGRHPDADILVFGHHLIDQDYRVLSTWQPDAERRHAAPSGFAVFADGVSARMPSIVFRRGFLAELGHFDETFHLSAADSDVVQRALLRGTAVFVPEVVSGYRTWPASGTSRTIATQAWTDDVAHWARKIQSELARTDAFRARAAAIADELRASNLLAGLGHLSRQQAYADMWRHLRRQRYPLRSRWRTQWQIVRLMLASVPRLGRQRGLRPR